MRVPLRELMRRPGRFFVAGASLALLTVLLLLLGGLLDGLFLGSTGAIRAQDADVFVYSSDAQESFVRSRIGAGLRSEIASVPGVQDTAGLGVALLAGQSPTDEQLVDVALFGYQAATDELPEPPPPGQGYADERLRSQGVSEGDVLGIGRTREPVEVIGFVEGTSYLLQGSLWVAPETWRSIQTASRPDAAVTDEVFQVLLVAGDDETSADDLASRIDEAAGGATTSLTADEAVFSIPGTRQQNSTFTALIGVTFFVVGLISALFFVLLTVERTRLFAAVKALGVPNRSLIVWSVLQSVAVAASAFAVGLAVTLPLAAAVPDEIPLLLDPSRGVWTLAILVATAAAGSLITLRRITRIDPAAAIS